MNISKNKVYIPATNNKPNSVSLFYANLMMTELANYGYWLDSKVHDRITRLPVEIAKGVVSEILKEYTVGELNKPLFPNWEDRTEFKFGEIVCQIFGYMFQISGNDLYDPNYMAKLFEQSRKAKEAKQEIQVIQQASDQEFSEYFEKLVGAKGTLDRKTSKKLERIFSLFTHHITQLPKIQSAEIRIAALLNLVKVKNSDVCSTLKFLQCVPVDALRYAAAKLDFESFKLPADVKYSNLSWKERKSIFEFLNSFDFETICEAMGINRGAWERFLKHTHFFGQPGFLNKFGNFYIAAFVSLGNRWDESRMSKKLQLSLKKHIDNKLVETTPNWNLVYRTFASRVMSAVEAKDWPLLKFVCKKNKGYIFRNLMTVSNGVQRDQEQDFIAYLRENMHRVPVGVLFSILTIDVKAKFRIIDAKGTTSVQPADYPPFIQDIQGDIKRFINSKYGFDGRVVVSPELENNAVPFLSKNSELPRGTRIPFADDKYLYFFMHWVQQGGRRTDLDHSYMVYDSNWTEESVWFGRQANAFMKQSGDITNAPAPKGGTEYGRIDLNKIPSNKKYLVPIINVFSGDVFSELQEARAGFFFSNSNKFSLDNEIIQYDLTQPAESNVPFIIDLEKKEIIVVDFNQRERYGWTAHSYSDELKKIIKALGTKNYMTIGEMAEMLSGKEKSISLKIGNLNDETKPEELFSIFN